MHINVVDLRVPMISTLRGWRISYQTRRTRRKRSEGQQNKNGSSRIDVISIPVRAEVSKPVLSLSKGTNEVARPSIPQGERAQIDAITSIRDEPQKRVLLCSSLSLRSSCLEKRAEKVSHPDSNRTA
jgi:hypothetical protein